MPGPQLWNPPGTRAGARGFFTGHFYSGNVRYFGYVYANVAAQMTADYLWDTLEKKTGRRTFYRQPDMARLLIEGQYQDGFRMPFPTVTEKLTGRKFRPQRLIEEINQPLEAFVKSNQKKPFSDCRKLLRR